MKVLVLGGSGYVGSRLCAMLAASGWATPVAASSRRTIAGVESIRLDTRDAAAMRAALGGIDAVVNCVAGDAAAIADGAGVLARAALAAGCRRIVHLSSMSVYGTIEGRVDESVGLDGSLGWYAKAKCDAERHVARFVENGGAAVVLRPGCVWGPGSELWVGRIGRLLRAGRLGDLGVAGDGWSNLVHSDDVCRAVLAALRSLAPGEPVRSYNLAAPDSPRWNEYFVDLALAIRATPVRRLAPLQLKADAYLAGPPLKVAEIVMRRFAAHARAVPVPLPPNLLGLWERHLQLDSTRAERELGLAWTPYASALQQSAAWFLREESGAVVERPPAVPGSDPAV
jgi:nucleoside-diphosphate-sugar epimerase